MSLRISPHHSMCSALLALCDSRLYGISDYGCNPSLSSAIADELSPFLNPQWISICRYRDDTKFLPLKPYSSFTTRAERRAIPLLRSCALSKSFMPWKLKWTRLSHPYKLVAVYPSWEGCAYNLWLYRSLQQRLCFKRHAWHRQH